MKRTRKIDCTLQAQRFSYLSDAEEAAETLAECIAWVRQHSPDDLNNLAEVINDTLLDAGYKLVLDKPESS